MLHVKTGDEKLDAMIKAIASRHIDSSSPDIAVCAENEEVPACTARLIVIYSSDSFTSGNLHESYVAAFGENYVSLSRPVSVSELDGVFRRFSRREACASIAYDRSVYDKERRTLTKDGKSVTLTEKESELYLILRESIGTAVSREYLRERLWKDTDGTNAPDVYVSYLRRKLNTILGEGSLVNVRGAGYLLKEE